MKSYAGKTREKNEGSCELTSHHSLVLCFFFFFFVNFARALGTGQKVWGWGGGGGGPEHLEMWLIKNT